MHDEVSKFAGVLSKLGVKKNDLVLIYMPMVPQAIVAMLATVRLGRLYLQINYSFNNILNFRRYTYPGFWWFCLQRVINAY